MKNVIASRGDALLIQSPLTRRHPCHHRFRGLNATAKCNYRYAAGRRDLQSGSIFFQPLQSVDGCLKIRIDRQGLLITLNRLVGAAGRDERVA